MNIKHRVGTCQNMCPKSELKNFDFHPPSPFECDMKGKFLPELAIKQYHRSDAGRIIEDCDLRPLPVLVKTMNHIINYVIGKKTNNEFEETSEIQMYRFVCGRIRSIGSDITSQSLDGEETIQIIQTSCLFFIWAESRFNMENNDSFDHKQNLDRITECNITLNILYDKYLIDNHRHFPSEPFYRAIDLITYLDNPGFMEKLLTFSEEITKSKYVQAVIEVRKAIIYRDISSFLHILDQVPVQMASYILQHSLCLWEEIGYAMRRTFGNRPFPKTFLTDYMKIPNEIIDKWGKSFSLSETPDRNYFNYNIKDKINTRLLPSVIIPEKFRRIRKFNNPIDFLQLDEDFSSFDILQEEPDLKKEIEQPVAPPATIENIENEIPTEKNTDQPLAMPTKEESNIDQETPISPPEPDFSKENKTEVSMLLNESHSDSHFPKLIPNRPNSTNPKLFKKDDSRISVSRIAISKKNLIISNQELFEEKISIKEIMAMIPYRVPCMSYVCILLIADDESFNSNFARNRFFNKSGQNTNNDLIVMCEKFRSSSETCFLLITKNTDQLGVTSIFYCDDSEEPKLNPKIRHDVPLIRFDSEFGFSPVLTFNSCLRKAIEAGITEIRPFNLSDLVQTIFSSFLKSISYTSWQFASANAVFKILNNGLTCISDHIIDDSFVKYILPFEHNEFDFEDLKKYAQKIKSLKFDLIDTVSSRRPINGSNWPTYIKSRVDISFPPFIIPLSVKFDQKAFISDIMSELPFQGPSETIF